MTTGRILLEETLDALMPLTDPYWYDLKQRIAQHLDYINCFESSAQRVQRRLTCEGCPFSQQCEDVQ